MGWCCHNILLDLHNSSHPTQPRSITAKYSAFFQSKHSNLQSFENHDPFPHLCTNPLVIWTPALHWFICNISVHIRSSTLYNWWALCRLPLFSFSLSWGSIECEQALLFGRVKRVSQKCASERPSREGQRKGELATISRKISFVLCSDEGKYHWLKNDLLQVQTDKYMMFLLVIAMESSLLLYCVVWTTFHKETKRESK